jgi:anthranilate phosphoribosyltransferase
VAFAPLIAGVFARRGNTMLVVRGDDGMDEITTTTTTSVWVVDGGEVRTDRIDPSALGIATALPEDLKGGDAATNAEVVRDLVAGKPGAVRDAVLLNAAGALATHGGLSGDLHADIANAMGRAAEAIDSGAAAELLRTWAARSTELKAALTEA